jgi:lipoyl(octanoyl) transferase
MTRTSAPPLERVDLGEIPYAEAMRAMDRWRAEREGGLAGDRLFLLSHPEVITHTGRTPPSDLPVAGHIPTVRTDRGGLATYHGPGQLVGYLVLDLTARPGLDILRWTEDRLIDACERLGFVTIRRETPPGQPSLTGVWTPGHAKLASIGLRIRRKVTSHGFALNVDPDMAAFHSFTACGLQDVTMTSLAEIARRRNLPVPADRTVRDAVGAAFTSRPGEGHT